ncbi:putative RNA polymerase II transcriptional coactivator [Porphyridium purpureum]|uniref:Putative RNA polymerase II transcriptional coactivator n=1 Tax=Porphyridium purpureum TaxID=35688 RepID=A0A5J4Z0Y3_PORPP|nr:putative RNA polymerase II transcriptional coactivator [Porphyridium purpureum]|eukprot:POR5303..scf208_2
MNQPLELKEEAGGRYLEVEIDDDGEDEEDEEDVEYEEVEEHGAKRKREDEGPAVSARATERPQKMKRNEQGELFLDLGSKKRLTVRVFQNRVGIDIREYYEKDGKQLPGKKGIWLTEEQFHKILTNQDEVKTTAKNALR